MKVLRKSLSKEERSEFKFGAFYDPPIKMQSIDHKKIKFKDLSERFQNYIFGTWFKSYRSSFECYHMDKEHYDTNFKRIIGRILSHEKTIFEVSEKNADLIGWLCGSFEPPKQVYLKGQPLLLHFLYVRKDFRRKGVAKTLLKAFNPEESGKLPVTFLTRNFIDAFGVEKYPYQAYDRFIKT